MLAYYLLKQFSFLVYISYPVSSPVAVSVSSLHFVLTETFYASTWLTVQSNVVELRPGSVKLRLWAADQG